jgi:cytochrome c-type biogenesis protein CcmF
VANFGLFILLAAFVVASGAFAASIAGARRRQTSLIEGGVGLFYALTALMLVASATIVHAFVTSDFSIRYVQRYSNAQQPLFYKIASYWGGLDGSIMFWVTLLAVFGSIAVYVNRERHRLLIPWVVATMAVVEMFFLFLMIIHNNPFSTFLGAAPESGTGLNPLLQNFYMVIHPPMLYTGFVGMTIPFAFGMAALASGQLDDTWLHAVRRWTMMAWLSLTVGLALGGLWAYEELGWGGYWMWDPVENAGLLPWFTATAFLHSVMVQERRGMLKTWNVSLVIVTFFLTIFGTFMTRSGVVQSVHAFGEDPELARLFTGFMIALLAGSFGLVIYRLPLLRARNELDSWMSREAAFLVNNWVLLFSAFFVLFATMFPTLSEAVMGERITVGPPFFNKWMVPIGLTLLFLTGFGPLLAWRKSTPANLVRQLLWPVSAAVVTGAWTLWRGISLWPSGLCFLLCALVLTTVAQEFIQGALVRRRATGTDVLTALVGLFARSRRRYAGYLVHVGVVLVFFGFAGSAFDQEEEALLAPGQQLAVNDYTVKYEMLSVTQDDRKQAVTATVEAFHDGVSLGQLYPARWFFSGREDEPTTEVALRRGVESDLYVVLAAYDAATQEVTLMVRVNPLVNWVWFGIGVLAVGALIALLPERIFAFATSPVSDAAVTASAVLLAVLLSPGVLLAQGVQPVARTTLERELSNEIMCTCGCRLPAGTCGMTNCQGKAHQLEKLRRLIAEGKSREEILAIFVRDYGSEEILARPRDQGFNRLAWLLPYSVGVVGIAVVGLVAVRWSRRRGVDAIAAPADGRAAPAAGLENRLNEELRDLD